MDTDDMIDDWESDSHTHTTISSSWLIYSVEFFSHERYLLLWDTNSSIWELYCDTFFAEWVLAVESCSLASIFDKIREDIVEYLYEHIGIHAHRIRYLSSDEDRLLIREELGCIFIDELLDLWTYRESLYMDIRRHMMCEVLILHNLLRDTCESRELCL